MLNSKENFIGIKKDNVLQILVQFARTYLREGPENKVL